MGVGAAGLEGGWRARVGHCRSAKHEGLAGAGQGCHMGLARCWRRGRGEVCRSILTAEDERGAVCGSGFGSLTPAYFQSSARPGDL